MELIVLLYDDEVLGKTHLNATMDQEMNLTVERQTVKKPLISEQVSFKAIMAALEKTKGNKTEAARYLGISRRTVAHILALYIISKMQKLLSFTSMPESGRSYIPFEQLLVG